MQERAHGERIRETALGEREKDNEFGAAAYHELMRVKAVGERKKKQK